jgi:sigma-B regulation protein RsbU (phosphoserine phosphatase)
MMGLPRSVADALDAVTYRQRALAFLQVDAALKLVGAGGNLENYGLGAVRLGERAADHVSLLEGLLPLPESPFFMPSIEIGGGRAADVHFYQDGECVWVVLLDVTAEREQAQRTQQRAYDMTLLQEKEALLNRRLEAANAALRASQLELETSRAALMRAHDQLNRDLAEAAGYLRSQLPAPISHPFAVDWRFVPSMALGGDALGYHWVDPDHFALYLLDVCGHGIGPSLMSVAVLHLLQAASLRDVDFRDPPQVLAALNDRYQMKGDNDLYFTLWYGVYRPALRQLDHACAGHPPAVMVDASSQRVELLKAKGPAVGLMPAAAFARETVAVPEGSRLYVFSDGAFEVERPDGSMMQLEDLVEFVRRPVNGGPCDLDVLFEHLLQARHGAALEDDFSIIRCAF